MSAFAVFVFGKPALHIRGDAGVDTFVITEKKVDEIHRELLFTVTNNFHELTSSELFSPVSG